MKGRSLMRRPKLLAGLAALLTLLGNNLQPILSVLQDIDYIGSFTSNHPKAYHMLQVLLPNIIATVGLGWLVWIMWRVMDHVGIGVSSATTNTPPVGSDPPPQAEGQPHRMNEMRIRLLAHEAEIQAERERERERPSVERLREVYPVCQRAAAYACEYVVADLFETSRHVPAHALIYDFLNIYVARTCNTAKEEMDAALSKPSTSLDELINNFRRLLVEYVILVSYIERAGGIIFGDSFESSEGYHGLYERHKQAINALELIRGRRDIGGAASELEKMKRYLVDRQR